MKLGAGNQEDSSETKIYSTENLLLLEREAV